MLIAHACTLAMAMVQARSMALVHACTVDTMTIVHAYTVAGLHLMHHGHGTCMSSWPEYKHIP